MIVKLLALPSPSPSRSGFGDEPASHLFTNPHYAACLALAIVGTVILCFYIWARGK